jgi:hypothetical protein
MTDRFACLIRHELVPIRARRSLISEALAEHDVTVVHAHHKVDRKRKENSVHSKNHLARTSLRKCHKDTWDKRDKHQGCDRVRYEMVVHLLLLHKRFLHPVTVCLERLGLSFGCPLRVRRNRI